MTLARGIEFSRDLLRERGILDLHDERTDARALVQQAEQFSRFGAT